MELIKIKKGFTLIEMLVVTGLITLVITSAAQIFAMVLRNNQKTRAIIETKQTGDSALSVLANKIRSARQVTSTCTSSTSPAITIEDSNGVSVQISCSSTGITLGSNTLIDTTADNLAIISPLTCFTCYPGGNIAPSIVAISFTLQKNGGNPVTGAELTFSTSVSLRNY
ncbi:MAG TPA: prepilin-type N-terminal cleavage/methylation domain-containing protein, partial [Candidatus Bathyarchaeia archaeon]|nr:prepilin-type N-terminal cleavage/methylation domain-containing protein [Candidatus Bathyarchaeia archaeon]